MEERKKQALSNGTRIVMMITIGIVFACIAILWMVQRSQPVTQNTKQEEASIHPFQNLDGLTFETAEGEEIILQQGDGEVSVLIYWASWCPHCVDSLLALPTLADSIENEGATIYLINKLDGEKETKEQALAFLQEKGIERETLFDVDCKNYEEIGLQMIPTTIVLDQNRMITSILEGTIPSEEQTMAMLAEAKQGKSVTLSGSIQKALLKADGGVSTTYEESDAKIPTGSDVLSESQGIMMEYAAQKGDQVLFEQTWNYLQASLFEEKLAPWVITAKEETNVNALVDDLRIIGSLQAAEEKWGGYQEAYETYLNAVYTYNTENNNFVDFYDVKAGKKAQRFTLCYGDLQTLSVMQKTDKRYRALYKNTLERIQDGRISEKFPLYYNYYDRNAQKYVGGNLHMAEQLTTLLHLAQVGELPLEALEWLEQRMEEGCIYAIYDTEGMPAAEGRFESTAVYALTAMIALESGREVLAGKAMNRMEQFKIQDSNSSVNGLFGEKNGNGIYSFDQGMALLAYERFERRR